MFIILFTRLSILALIFFGCLIVIRVVIFDCD